MSFVSAGYLALWIDDREQICGGITAYKPWRVEDPALFFALLDFDLDPVSIRADPYRFEDCAIGEERIGREGCAGAAAHIDCHGADIAEQGYLKVANGQLIKMNMSVRAIKGLNVEADFPGAIISICDLPDQLVIDMEKKVGPLSVHA